MPRFTPMRLFWAALAVAVAASAAASFLLEPSIVRAAARLLLASLLVLASVVASFRLLRWFLWRVGRRLAFSYVLIGVVPIPMVLALGAILLYLLSGYFLSHRYRTALDDARDDLRREAEAASAHAGTVGPISTRAEIAVALYDGGRRLSDHPELPSLWPTWATEATETPPPLWQLPDGTLTLVATASRGGRAALAYFPDGIEQALAERSGVWVSMLDPRETASTGTLTVQLGSGSYALSNMAAGIDHDARNHFFGLPTDPTSLPWKLRPLLWWGEVTGPALSLADGSRQREWMTASLNGTVQGLEDELFSASAELNAAVWASLIGVTGLLSSIYLIALGMALFMIFTLSRAVNRLSRATDAVRSGDFSQRIPVRRHDQIGELQHSFNDMTRNLETLVGAAAQKELLEKELEIARDLQESLLPAEVPATERVEFSTLFEPSAAIGGDYFDILRIDDDRLAVVIADVSGHGLPTGLRMAMLKAALVILVEEQKPASEILRRLNAMVRAENRQRFFVTATIAVVDFARDRLEITNAGHPPTYLIREGEVDEVLLAGSPLGALDESYRHRELRLERGDVVVWLSDGLIEATSPNDDPFGYEATAAALAGSGGSATEVRDRLLAAVEAHCAGRAADDDRTLVAMRYFPEDGGDGTSMPRKA